MSIKADVLAVLAITRLKPGIFFDVPLRRQLESLKNHTNLQAMPGRY
jgi:hypothetical protein